MLGIDGIGINFQENEFYPIKISAKFHKIFPSCANHRELSNFQYTIKKFPRTFKAVTEKQNPQRRTSHE